MRNRIAADVTITNNGQTNTLTLSGRVTAGDAFSGTMTDPTGGQNGATLGGRVAGNTDVGTCVGNGDSGTFRLAK